MLLSDWWFDAFPFFYCLVSNGYRFVASSSFIVWCACFVFIGTLKMICCKRKFASHKRHSQEFRYLWLIKVKSCLKVETAVIGCISQQKWFCLKNPSRANICKSRQRQLKRMKNSNKNERKSQLLLVWPVSQGLSIQPYAIPWFVTWSSGFEKKEVVIIDTTC